MGYHFERDISEPSGGTRRAAQLRLVCRSKRACLVLVLDVRERDQSRRIGEDGYGVHQLAVVVRGGTVVGRSQNLDLQEEARRRVASS